MTKVAIEVAQKEIAGWLDYKKINEKKRESSSDSIDLLVDAVSEGLLVVKEDKTLVQTLKFATEGEKKIVSLEYKPRLRVGAVHDHLQSVKSTDVDGRICAYIAALTSQNKGVIRLLDVDDYAIGQAIAVFFL